MHVVASIDVVSSILLLWAFYAVWKEKKRFYSLLPLLPALGFLFVGRVCNILVEHPAFHSNHLLGLSFEWFEILFGVFGNVTDAIGISLLIFGFIKIIKHEQEEQKLIRNLESLLPLCSNCKKYRTADNQWLPIEKYLIENGAPTLTHGICPDCAKKLYGHYTDTKRK